MPEPILQRIQAIDTDTHVTEPPDVWTSRVSTEKWGDMVPHVKNVDGIDLWLIGDEPAGGPGWTTMAGFDGSFPDHPRGYGDIPRAAFDAKERLAFMDRESIHAEVLYPNVGGFGSGGFLKLKQPELMLECVRAYNDFLLDWCSADPARLIPVMANPFWDVQAAVEEIERCARLGYKAVLASSMPRDFGEPPLASRHWDPFWAAAQDAGMSISFHIGAGDLSDLVTDEAQIGARANFARVSSLVFMSNSNCLAELIFGGVCHRFPDLKMVSVESGVGWIPAWLEAADWQWINAQVHKEHPDWDLLPSEYFKRQIYGCFWFEEQGLDKAIELYPDNILWETDYPHPTCQHPGLSGGVAQRPIDYADKALGHLPDPLLKKVLNENAAKLYLQ